jgi:2-oxoisovalerate dehydrogenase E2 component (dihydrolipoyl transacylase)
MSNIGAVGAGTYAGPLILPPQVCITAIGNTSTLPRFDHSNIEKVIPRKIVNRNLFLDSTQFFM